MHRVTEQEKEHSEWSSSSLKDSKPIPQQFDFTTENDIAEEIAEQIESLSQTQLKLLKKQVECFKKDSKKEQERESKRWFENAVVPVLKAYTERSEACLEIEENGEKEITAAIRSHNEFDITMNDCRMKMLLLLAGHISIEKDEDGLLIVLAFDLENFFS